MSKKTRTMEDLLRQAIRESGMPQNRICRAAKMDEGTLSCFMLGKQESMRLKTAQRLARVLGLQLILEPKSSSAPKASPKAKEKPKAKAKAKPKTKRGSARPKAKAKLSKTKTRKKAR